MSKNIIKNLSFLLFVLFTGQLNAQSYEPFTFESFLNENFDLIIAAFIGISAIAGFLIVSKNTIKKILLQTQLQIDAQAEQTRLQMEFQYKLNKKQIITDLRKNELEDLANDLSKLINIFRQGYEVNSLKWQHRDAPDLKVIDEITEVIKIYDDKKYECDFLITKLKLKIGKNDKNYEGFFGSIETVYNLIFSGTFHNNVLQKDIDRLITQIIIAGENIILERKKELEKL